MIHCSYVLTFGLVAVVVCFVTSCCVNNISCNLSVGADCYYCDADDDADDNNTDGCVNIHDHTSQTKSYFSFVTLFAKTIVFNSALDLALLFGIVMIHFRNFFKNLSVRSVHI